MADINTPVSYDGSIEALVRNKLSDPTFTYKNWDDDDLAVFRKLVRDHYRTEQNGSCAFCKAPISLTAAANCHVEHLVPKSKRREFIFEPKNLCVICADCNQIKRAKETEGTETDPLKRGDKAQLYPRSSKAFLIVHPHFDIWDEHIAQFGKLYVDLTDKGHYTIGVCVLNRQLRKLGWEAVVTDEAQLRRAVLTWLNSTDSITAARALAVMRRLLVAV